MLDHDVESGRVESGERGRLHDDDSLERLRAVN